MILGLNTDFTSNRYLVLDKICALSHDKAISDLRLHLSNYDEPLKRLMWIGTEISVYKKKVMDNEIDRSHELEIVLDELFVEIYLDCKNKSDLSMDLYDKTIFKLTHYLKLYRTQVREFLAIILSDCHQYGFQLLKERLLELVVFGDFKFPKIDATIDNDPIYDGAEELRVILGELDALKGEIEERKDFFEGELFLEQVKFQLNSGQAQQKKGRKLSYDKEKLDQVLLAFFNHPIINISNPDREMLMIFLDQISLQSPSYNDQNATAVKKYLRKEKKVLFLRLLHFLVVEENIVFSRANVEFRQRLSILLGKDFSVYTLENYIGNIKYENLPKISEEDKSELFQSLHGFEKGYEISKLESGEKILFKYFKKLRSALRSK